MSIEIALPQLGVEMTSAIIAEWSCSDGAEVVQDDVIAIVETDKVSYEITAPVAGTVRKVAVEGEEYPVGALLAIIGNADDPPPARTVEPSPSIAVPASADLPAPAAPASTPTDPAGAGMSVLATPLARRLARNAGISLADIVGTGRRGQIRRADVEAAQTAASRSLEHPPQSTQHTAPEGGVSLTPLRRTIARRMLDSLHTTAQMTDVREIDVSAALDLRRAMLAQADELGFRPSINTMFLKAVALAVRAVPELNVTFVDGQLFQHNHVNLGMAVAVQEGLVVPVIRDVDQLSLRDLQEEAARLSALARDRKLLAADLADGTFTVTNIGSYGSHFGTPVLNPPQVAVLATGAVLKRPVVRDDAVVVGEAAHFSLTVDHQIVDGDTIGRFHHELTRILSTPYLLLVN